MKRWKDGGDVFSHKKGGRNGYFSVFFLGQIVTLYFHLRNSCFSSAARIIVSRKFPRNFRRRKGKEKGKRDVLTFPPCGHGKEEKRKEFKLESFSLCCVRGKRHRTCPLINLGNCSLTLTKRQWDFLPLHSFSPLFFCGKRRHPGTRSIFKKVV